MIDRWAWKYSFFFSVFFLLINLFIYLFYFWLCWVFVSVRGLSLVAASGGHSSLRCAGLSLSRPLLLWSTGSRCAGSVVVAHRPSCSAACGIFPDQGSNLCPLHWQADSQPLCHQRSPESILWSKVCCDFSSPGMMCIRHQKGGLILVVWHLLNCKFCPGSYPLIQRLGMCCSQFCLCRWIHADVCC